MLEGIFSQEMPLFEKNLLRFVYWRIPPTSVDVA